MLPLHRYRLLIRRLGEQEPQEDPQPDPEPEFDWIAANVDSEWTQNIDWENSPWAPNPEPMVDLARWNWNRNAWPWEPKEIRREIRQ